MIVLIKGMEMPDNCGACPLETDYGTCGYYSLFVEAGHDSEIWKRRDDCPLVEVPPHWIPVSERLPDCEWGAEVGNIEWISCGMVFAGCFGRGGKYRDAYFRTWTDGTEGIDAKDADYWRPIQIPEPPKEDEE